MSSTAASTTSSSTRCSSAPTRSLGCPGLLTAARAGNVTIANAVGNGVADDKLIYTYLPDLVRYYLGEEPVLPNVDTWRLEEPGALRGGARPAGGAGRQAGRRCGRQGAGDRPAGHLPRARRLRKRLLADPRGWIAQPVVQLSTVPTLAGDGIAARHVDLRPFAVNDGNDVWVLPGGLTRVALVEGSLVVNSSQGGGSKDTWVLAGERSRWATPRPSAPPPGEIPPLPVQDEPAEMPMQSQQQQQQQQQQMSAAVTC